MTVYESLLGFFIYGFCGWCVEVIFAAVRKRKFVNRGFLNGPICPIYGIGVICVVQSLGEYQDNLFFLYMMSVLVATSLEWIVGLLLDKLFHQKWWDYSHIPGNIQGYVCLPFSFVWGIACVVVTRSIHPWVLRLIQWIPKSAGSILLVVLLPTLFADLYVTVNGILKLNLKLEKMQRTAEELQKLSVHLGENISRNVLEGIEKQENAKQRIEEVRVRYQELMESTSSVNLRLIRAFPKLESRRYGKQLQELKDFFRKKADKN